MGREIASIRAADDGSLGLCPQRVRAEPGRQTMFSAFWAANASGESNCKGTFTKNVFVFSLFTSNNVTSLGEAQIGQHIMPFNIMLRLSQFVQLVICC